MPKPRKPKTLREALNGRTGTWLHCELAKGYDVAITTVCRWVRLPDAVPSEVYHAPIKRITGFDYSGRSKSKEKG